MKRATEKSQIPLAAHTRKPQSGVNRQRETRVGVGMIATPLGEMWELAKGILK